MKVVENEIRRKERKKFDSMPNSDQKMYNIYLTLKSELASFGDFAHFWYITSLDHQLCMKMAVKKM